MTTPRTYRIQSRTRGVEGPLPVPVLVGMARAGLVTSEDRIERSPGRWVPVTSAAQLRRAIEERSAGDRRYLTATSGSAALVSLRFASSALVQDERGRAELLAVAAQHPLLEVAAAAAEALQQADAGAMAVLAQRAVDARRRVPNAGPRGKGIEALQGAILQAVGDDPWHAFVEAARRIDGRDGAPMVWPNASRGEWIPPDQLFRLPRRRLLESWNAEPVEAISPAGLPDAMRQILASDDPGDFDGLPITDLDALPRDVKDGIRALESVSLSGTLVRTVPAWLLEGKDSVDLSCTPLERLPELPVPPEIESGDGDGLATTCDRLSLDLSDTRIRGFPASWAMHEMSDIDVSRCPLRPYSFENLPVCHSLRARKAGLMEITEFNSAPVRLDLEGNWFVDFPEALRDFFESIEHLDLAANRITEIPDWVADEGRDLEELLLGANCITRVRVALSELPNLETVDLSDNAIVEISRRAFGSGRLDVIKLAGNRLASMPPIVWPRHVLDLSGNPLTELPGCLNDHAIPDVPWHGTVHDGSDDDTDEDDDDERDDALDDAPAASHGTYQGEYESPESCAIRLDASRTRIELFPADLLELKFGTIVLRGCERLRAIPAELLWMRTLDSLDCGGCSSLSELHSPERGPWESWPAQRSAAVTAAIDDRFPNIAPQLVDFSGTAFREVPRILGMDHVRCDVQCHMQGSAVERWPEGQATANLVCMRLDDTPLSELPSLAGMEWLQELSLPHRELASLPADIAQCTDLRVLFLPGLPVERYPADLSSLVSLGSLGIWGPRLTAIPAFVTTLRRLTTLALANVSLVEVPALLARCPRLSELSVQGSPLRRIDPSVLAMRTLSTLRVHGAPALDVLQFPSGCALQTLDLGIAGTVCIDPSIVNCTKLERLDLSESASAVLPDQLLGLPNLRQIAIGSSARWERLAAWIRSARPDIECIPPVDDGASEE